MKKLGKVFVINKNGNLLVKVTKTYRLNSIVVNQQLKRLGKIVDIIGPAKNPYLVINAREAEAKPTKGETVYLMDRPKKTSSKRKPSKSKSKK
jgi:rRNA processing protein Gar1